MSSLDVEKKAQSISENIIHSLKLNTTAYSSKQPSWHPIPGLAKGEFKYPDDINLYDDEKADIFYNEIV